MMKTRRLLIPGLLCALFYGLTGCREAARQPEGGFRLMTAQQTGIDFVNRIEENPEVNITQYEYMYNGAGVAAGDVDGDGLPDLYFAGNMSGNRLYRNLGNMRFEDITESAGTGGHGGWATGVSMADVNGDGRLDIYVCYSGPGDDSSRRRNELFINEGGNPVRFSERAADYGLDAPGSFSTHCVFFDMDRDGDLDALLVNHANEFYNTFVNTVKLRRLRNPIYGNCLYRNDGGQFTDVSEAAGIDGSHINFGLGAAVGDVNNDGWPDIYVTNDYNEQDFLYLNNRNGSFTEVLQTAMGHISMFSMGADMADINDDGWPDVVTLDMLPEDHYRQKLLKGPDGFDQYHRLVANGFHHQNMRNMLQLHMGLHPGDNLPRFSEIGQLAGISRTDWSWAPLIADFDNDGRKDLFVTNGYLRDFTNLDFLKFTYPEQLTAQQSYGDSLAIWKAISELPGTPVPNYMFRNLDGLQFEKVTEAWGMSQPTISQGAAWADLDGDGDLDLVINNLNSPAMCWRNNWGGSAGRHYLSLRLQGPVGNPWAVGATVVARVNGIEQHHAMYPNKGYQSSVEPLIHMGLGEHKRVEVLEIRWPDGKRQSVSVDSVDRRLTVSYAPNLPETDPSTDVRPVFLEMNNAPGFTHQPMPFIDFKRQFLMPHQVSRQGPFLAKADVNGDGLEDLLVTGNERQPTTLFLQQADGRWQPASAQPWQAGGPVPDGGAVFFDADGDGDMDLYLAKMGMEGPEGDAAYQHRLFLNDGRGRFVPATDALPTVTGVSVSVATADYNRDGKTDLYVSCRAVPGRYPVTPVSYLLKNVTGSDGRPRFEYAREQASALLRQPGMVTRAVFADLNADGWPDLVVAGEFMPVTVFINREGQLTESAEAGLNGSDGWWAGLAVADVDGDGHPDIVGGNGGLNMPVQVSASKPATVWYNDYDANGVIDPFLVYTIGNVTAPGLSLDDAAEQVPMLKKRFLNYEQYARAEWKDLFDAKLLAESRKHYAYDMRSCWWRNDGKGRFTRQELPLEAQFSVVQAVNVADVDGDGINDLLLAGNYYPWRVQWGRMDASFGWWLKGDGKGGFTVVYPDKSGFWAGGDVRDMVRLGSGAGVRWVLSRFGGALSEFRTGAVR